MTDTALHAWSARELAAAVAARDVSAVEVMRAHLARIEEFEGRIAAFVSLLPESESLAMAEQADRAVARGDRLGVLHGLPTGVKDLMDVAGLPTSQGSAAYASEPPATRDSVLAEHLRRAGALIIGKTNTPEIGLGTLTFNPVRGVCRNPWDLSRHAGGSSGGAAAAVAAGMLPIADGSDSGGSIRYPSSFCNTVGLRPTPGMVPSGRTGNGWDPHGVAGPMARDSRDAALMLAGIAGHDRRWPISWVDEPRALADLDEIDLSGLRLGWSPDVWGLPIDREVRRVLADARRRLESAGVVVIDVEPDLDGADEAWQAIEMFGFAGDARPRFAEGRTGFRDDYLRNVQEGFDLSATELMDALAHRTELFRRTAAVLQEVDAIVYPATPVAAPPAEVEWVAEVDGVAFDRYFLWQRAACRLTVTGHPVLATPAGFTQGGLPVGMQLVGASRRDARLLAIGAAIESALGLVGAAPTAIRA
ncbi:amidase [Microbacterium sp. AG1240]|uniref:amidase n=1 Tax=Microbacterium sp. AG1240 TaxID=2183992 RepID=UPI000EAE92E5|nr:amidase family protein [Microbacterium sp. AG1240]RKT35814.1 amidase [Microbacterium sp. AG1240]